MAYEGYNWVHNKVPPLGSDLMQKFAKELFDEYQYFYEASQDLREVVWPACDQAYHCRRELPEAEGMDWADTSDRGETDVRDGVNFLAQAMTLALLPRDETAFAIVSKSAEEQGISNDIRDMLASLCRRIDLRGRYERHVLQTLIRGTSALWLTWRREPIYRQYDMAETLTRLASDPNPPLIDDPKMLHKIKFQEPGRNEPDLQVIDMSNLLLDPCADLGSDGDMSIAVVTFRTVEQLKNAVDRDGQPLYDQEQLKDIRPMSLDEIYDHDRLRFMSVEVQGLNPRAQGDFVKRVPVIVFHKKVRNFEDNQWVDCFFHLALTGEGQGCRLIRVQENPNNYGRRCIFIDTYQDWISGNPYGTGIVEHSLAAYTQKNVISALTMNADLASVFPAISVVGGILQDDRKLKIGPGAMNIINWKPAVGQQWIAPLPIVQNGAQLGKMDQQFLGQKILGQMGAYGSIMQDPTKSVKSAKTATQINTETTSGSVMRDNLLERMTIRSLEPLMNAIFEMARENLDDADLIFEKVEEGDVKLKQLDKSQFSGSEGRLIVTAGFHGMMNKAREVEELRETLQVISQSLEAMPALQPLYQETLFKLLGRLGVKNLDKYKQDPAEILAQSPIGQQMQQQAMQQGYMAAMQQAQGPPPEQMQQQPEEVPLQ